MAMRTSSALLETMQVMQHILMHFVSHIDVLTGCKD